MIVDQNSFDSIILDMYSLFPLVFIIYLKHVNLGAQSISLGIHFFINALILRTH
jgi:hypothetical protein